MVLFDTDDLFSFWGDSVDEGDSCYECLCNGKLQQGDVGYEDKSGSRTLMGESYKCISK